MSNQRGNSDYPFVSVIIINFNGRHHLDECFKSLYRMNYPKAYFEIIMVDNGSVDGSIEFVQEEFTEVRVIRNNTNEGFAKPNNDAARVAKGEYLAFLNNDMRVDKNWLKELVYTIKENDIECAGSKIINWYGDKIDFVGGSLNFYGHGFQYDFGKPASEVEGKYSSDQEILFACGGAMIINREVYLEVGGFDEDYFAYFEDVDLGWRLWILGYKIKLSAKSIAYHKHNSTSKKLPNEKVKVLFERNALYTIYKNTSEKNVDKLMSSSLLLLANRAVTLSEVDIDKYNIQNTLITNDNHGLEEVNKISFSHLVAMDDFVRNIKKLKAKRDFVQKNRKNNDNDIYRFFTNPYTSIPMTNGEYKRALFNIIKCFGIENLMNKPIKQSIVIISSDRIGEKMAGPGIRYWEMANVLKNDLEVTLAVPGGSDIKSNEFEIIDYSFSIYDELTRACQEADIILLQGFILEHIPSLKELCKEKVAIIDIYDPFVIENLEVHKDETLKLRLERHLTDLKVLNEQLKIGDYFICASDKQKDFWIGMLSSLNKINPIEYNLDKQIKKLIGVVPFGIKDDPPVHNSRVLKGVWKGIDSDDKVIIWGGGVWNWFDPLTLIKAIKNISLKRTDIKLFFMGVKHPNPDVPEMKMTNEAINLAGKLGVLDKYVFFNHDWIPYNERHNFLLEADIGVSCHFDNLETRFSFRTRILDYLWARLPIISTEGDYFSELIKNEKLGITVNFEDVEELENAILMLLDNKSYYHKCKENVNRAAEQFKWSNVIQDLKDFCSYPIKKEEVASFNSEQYILDIDQQDFDMPAGELVKSTTFSQTFRCRYPNLFKIDLFVATYGRKNNSELRITLKDSLTNTILAIKEYDTAKIVDNSWVEFSFKPIINSEGKQFIIELEDSQADPGNCITFWINSKEELDGGKRYTNNNKLPGSLCIKTYSILSKKRLSGNSGICVPETHTISDRYINNEIAVTSELTEDLDPQLANIITLQQLRNRKVHEIEQQVKLVEQNIVSINQNINNINGWIMLMNNRLKKLKKVTPISLLKRLLKK